VVVRPAPRLRDIRCLSGCAGGGARPGSRLRIRGRNMRQTDLVVFLGAAGEADDVAATPLRRLRRSVDVRMPFGAAAGPVTVTDRNGVPATAVRRPLALAQAKVGSGAESESAPMTLAASDLRVEAQVAAPRGFFDAAVPPRINYVVHGTQAADVTIEVVRSADGVAVAGWPAGTVEPESPQTASWDGIVAGKVQPAGRYSFRVLARAPGAPQAVASQTSRPDPTAFVFLGNVFPVRGAHGYGERAASFGGGRNHKGHDVFAACGTPLVAARGGIVKYKRYQSAAGHYVVIDAQRSGIDYAYMHLRQPALVDEGDRVRTGQLIGAVGDTGRAFGCHLHLELWTAPGWYSGGSAFDPLPSLLAWDRTS
jgi:murein DD-endopeptidase MepM/ murein hydrolase activator NlpD